MKTLLFICTGNTCRSPMAEAMMNQLLRDRGVGEWRAQSAGIAAMDGVPMSENARLALQELAVKAHEHWARRATAELIAGAELILTMETRHVRAVLDICPEAQGKVHTLKNFAAHADSAAGESYDVCDPFGRPLSAYIACAGEIAAALEQVLERLGGEGPAPDLQTV